MPKTCLYWGVSALTIPAYVRYPFLTRPRSEWSGRVIIISGATRDTKDDGLRSWCTSLTTKRAGVIYTLAKTVKLKSLFPRQILNLDFQLAYPS